MPLVAILDARIVLVALPLKARLGLRLRHQQRDAASVGRPPERADGVAAIGELVRFAAAHRQAIELRGSVAIGEERNRRAVRRPARRRVVLPGERQLTKRAGCDVEHPDRAGTRCGLHRFRDAEQQPRAVGGKREPVAALADGPPIERLLGRKRRCLGGEHDARERRRDEYGLFHSRRAVP